jgi:large subunit ribosomal protein L22
MATTETPRKVRAVAKWVRISPRKARLVLEHIRGRSVPEARTVLAFTPRAAAKEVEKVLRSAVANAEANHGLVGDELVVSHAVADDAIVLKRWRAQARGRVHRIRKRTSHITIELDAPAGATIVERPQPQPAPEPAPAEEPEPETEEAPAEVVAEEPEPEETEEKPKRRRSRRRKTEPDEGDT